MFHRAEAYYSSELWEVGEFVIEKNEFLLKPRELNLPRGAESYKLVLDFVNPETGKTLPVTINGEAIEGGYPLPPLFSVGG